MRAVASPPAPPLLIGGGSVALTALSIVLKQSDWADVIGLNTELILLYSFPGGGLGIAARSASNTWAGTSTDRATVLPVPLS